MSSSKRGLGWPYDNKAEAFQPYGPIIDQRKLTWLFNWEMWKPDGLPNALEYVPQVRTQAEADKIDQVRRPMAPYISVVDYGKLTQTSF